MTDSHSKADSKKTIFTFIFGLIIGGLLVWAFTPDHDDHDKMSKDNSEMKDADDHKSGDEEIGEMTTIDSNVPDTSEMTEDQTSAVGSGQISLNDQPAGVSVELGNITFPQNSGWIGVRDYNEGNVGFALGVARFDIAGGLTPNSIALQRPTIAGTEYAVVFYTEDGNNSFNPSGDIMIEGIMTTFTAQ